ncbi:MAG: 3-dehydroquinate synthase [Balneolaceae bacterium]|nr:MAG: 3-dehydroquinate synthase [Balneolaceae bacterium]
MQHSFEINSASGSYNAMVGADIFGDSVGRILEKKPADKVFLLIDENVESHHGDYIINTLKSSHCDVEVKIVPQGEGSKSVPFWEEASTFLLENGVRRNTPLFVAGGGVTGDLGGFVAATTLRGIPLVHIPTTLLAMVDSSIGGKTGINHHTGKNLIGAFYRPDSVVADIRFLDTLPRNEWINGLSEILKYGAISDNAIFDDAEIFLQADISSGNADTLINLIAKCIRIKADIVQKDEFEGNIRAFLNFGHTFAHALEKECGFNAMSHGEAVFLGMLAAARLSNQTGSKLHENRLDKFRPLYSYRVTAEELNAESLTHHMRADKKRIENHIRFVLLDDWQHPVLKTVKDEELIYQAWRTVFSELQNRQKATI